MGKFLEGLLKFLSKLKFFRFGGQKFLQFLLDLFSGEKGEIVEEIQNTVNNVVHTVEAFDDSCKLKLYKKEEFNSLDVIEEIEMINPNCLIIESDYDEFEKLLDTIREIENLKTLSLSNENTIGFTGLVDYTKDILTAALKKAELKFTIAINMLVRDFEKNGQRYTIQTIRFCIEAAVLRNYGK